MPRFRRTRALVVGLTLAAMVAAFSIDYTVQRGDTLSRIADDNDVSLTALIKANDIANPDLIYPGQVLIIPGEKGKPDKIYVVVSGDTLNAIGASFGVPASTIAKVNALVNPDLIFPGQELVIKAGSTGSSGSSGSGSSGGEVDGGSTRSGKYHIVRSGESVSSIAAQYSGVTADDIIRANGIVNGAIYTGTRLFLDGPGYVAKGSGGATTYTVRQGDRLVDIAAKYATTVTKLATLNDISNINLIRSGQVLKIPGGGQWVCPLADSSFFNDWGFPRSGGRYHEGNDLFAPFGSKVRAPVSGRVVFKVGTIGGNQFNLTGDDGVVYIGSHMDDFAGKSRRVSAGEVIGYVGSSGNAIGSSPHLHFGMYWSGTVVNPYPSLLANGCK